MVAPERQEHILGLVLNESPAYEILTLIFFLSYAFMLAMCFMLWVRTTCNFAHFYRYKNKCEFCKSKYEISRQRIRYNSGNSKSSYLNSPVTNIQENV